MKNKLLASLFSSLLVFTLVACASSPTDSSSSTGEASSSTSISESSSSEVSSSSTSSSSIEASKKISSVTFTDKNEYHVGDVYNPSKITVTAKYNDGTKETITKFSAKVSGNITEPNGDLISPTKPFQRAGSHNVPITVTIDGQKYTNSINIKALSGFVSEGYVLNSVSVVGGASFSLGHIVANELRELDLLLVWNKGKEYYTYKKDSDKNGITFSLKKDGDEVNDYINTPLEQNETYNLILNYKDESYPSSSFTVYDNYYKLSGDDLSFMPSDIDKAVTSPKGDVKILVVPITLSGKYVTDWTKTQLNNIQKYYFGTDPTKVSLKQYFETASYGKVNIVGTMVDSYAETSEDLTDDRIISDTEGTKIYQLLQNAIEYIRTNSDIDLDEYDTNDDGILDNVHFITNFSTKNYQKQTGYSASGTPFWAHRGRTLFEGGTKENPIVDSFILSSNDQAKDAITSIHEQGHNFGLDDYYDYYYTVDYIGGADMQSYNIFDWNSYSKFLMGWVSPYVVTGETTITISAASLNGDCIVVPANPNTFNNSAYDEYFLIELFSEYGNNALNYPVNGVYQGTEYEYYRGKYGDLGDYGVRLYHVDSRMMYWDPSTHAYYEATTEDKDRWLFLPFSNSYYGGGEDETGYDDYKLLSIIQKGGVDTFGDPYANHFLSKDDLFRQGDVFTFSKYKHFLSKSGKTVTTMDNGETFPYKITFTSMSATQTTVKIELA